MTISASIVNVGTLGGGWIIISSINDAGQAVGNAWVGADASTDSPVLWQNGTLTNLNTITGVSGTRADLISDSGQIVIVNNATGNQILQLGSNGLADATVATINTKAPLGFFRLIGIANGGVSIGDDTNNINSGLVIHAALYSGGTFADLPIDQGPYSYSGASQLYTNSFVTGLSRNGHVALVAETADFHYTLAYEYWNGTAQLLAPPAGGINSYVTGINDAGTAIGYWNNRSGASAVEWTNGSATPLARLAGASNSASGSGDYPQAINDVGQISGFAINAAGKQVAVVWQDGGVIDLNSLLPANSGWILTGAGALNENGQVAVYGTHNGGSAAAIMTLSFSAADAANSAYQSYFTHIGVLDSAANLASHLDGLESLASAGKAASIAFTDSGVATLAVTAVQVTADKDALADISGLYTLSIAAPAVSAAIAGYAGHANTVVFSGDASQYTVISAGDGGGLTVSGNGITDHLSGIQALQFADYTDIVASQTPPAAGAVSSAQITELYAAVLGRTPDIAGLSFYQTFATANPSTPFLQYAEWFLGSPEYTGNAQHAYAQSAAGDAQFITDSYDNLLHRGPEADAIPYYQKVIAQFTANLASGTAAYGAAQLQGHAQMLVYLSQSPEFLADVSVTAQNPSSASHWLLLI